MTESVKRFLQEMTASANKDKKRWQKLGKVCGNLAALVDVYPSWHEALAAMPSLDVIRGSQKSLEAMRNSISVSRASVRLLVALPEDERESVHHQSRTSPARRSIHGSQSVAMPPETARHSALS
ncbi:MAG: hypothetical protein LBK55_11975 [Azoarcus sp.]|jgi:hypothetical protein|nr:hypothetical protein [Azoarcus sp.]